MPEVGRFIEPKSYCLAGQKRRITSMQELTFRVVGVVVASGLGLGWGWVAGRVFTRPFVQDVTAALVGWILGSTVPIGAVLGGLMVRSLWSQGFGGGVVSGGASETVLFGLPLTVLLTVGARPARRWVGGVGLGPVILGGPTALLAAVLVATTISSAPG